MADRIRPHEGNCLPAVPAGWPVALALKDGGQTNCGFTARKDGFHTLNTEIAFKEKDSSSAENWDYLLFAFLPRVEGTVASCEDRHSHPWVVRGDAAASV